MNEKKKIVWITGASSGIGKAISEEFVANGICVAGTSRRIELLNELKNNLGELFIPFILNVADKFNVEALYKKISEEYEIETLINNAGITSFKKVIDDNIETMEQIIQTNLLGSIYTIKNVLPEMIERKSGTIINILSVVTQKIFTSSSAYSASKSGIFMIGGGVPKNFTQDIVVAADLLQEDAPMHKYAIQITVADVRDGALSSSTLKEASSWGKVETTFEQMVYSEATLAMPLVAGYAYHKGSWKERKPKELTKIYSK